jgi:hypothetical protein
MCLLIIFLMLDSYLYMSQLFISYGSVELVRHFKVLAIRDRRVSSVLDETLLFY